MTAPGTIVVIGASAGGVDALRAIVAALPRDFDAAVFVTLHIGSHRSELPWLLARVGTLPASHAVQGETIQPAHIYVAPPDHHLVVEAKAMALTRGPRENMARPAIDPMFRSAAEAHGDKVIGIILTGGLNDGTAGLMKIKARGGICIVQDPAGAFGPGMPQSAIDNVAVDHVCGVDAMGPLLVRLVAARRSEPDAGQEAAQTPERTHGPAVGNGQDHEDADLTSAQEEGMTAQFTLHRPVAVTCPDCGGALRQHETGSLTQFGCHIGHVYTAEVMMAAQFLAMERFVEQAMRSLSERGELCRVMMEKAGTGDPGAARQWAAAMDEALEQTAPLRELLTRAWQHPLADGPIEASSP